MREVGLRASALLASALARLAEEKTYAAYTAASSALRECRTAEINLPEVRIAVLRNFTVDPVIPVIEGELALAGMNARVQLGTFDGIALDVLNEASSLYRFEPHFVIITLWLEMLAPRLATRFISLSSADVELEIEQVLQFVKRVIAGLRDHIEVPVLVNNFPLPAYPTLGILDGQSSANQTGSVIRLNLELQRLISRSRDTYLLDLMSLCNRLGNIQAIDSRYWHIGRAPLARHVIAALGAELGKFVLALRGKTRKCLILDCDNTLWGGVVGEEGLEGLQLGSTYPGSCFVAFQKELLNLHDRGIILALCSKNSEEDVMEVIRRHPDMLLKEEHFAIYEINWDDKSTNIQRIAKRLNIGLDSLVFADDSKFECDLVRAHLPEVAVLHLGDDPSTFVNALSRHAYFDSLSFSTEDRQRTTYYHAEFQRETLRSHADSMEAYLSSLDLVARIGHANELTIPRIAQLTQKTNQFNLTTRRYTEGEITHMASNSTVDVFSLSLSDRVSDTGLVGVAILKYDGNEGEIDSLLMSCRALGRGAEAALLDHCIFAARRRGCARLIGRFVPSKRNEIAAGFFPGHGFVKVSESSELSVWELVLENSSFSLPAWLKVELRDKVENVDNQ